VTGFSAFYDLRHRIVTYDFFYWLVYVQILGATEIVINPSEIKSSKYPLDEAKERLNNFILPGPALAGLPCRIGNDGVDCGSHKVDEFVKLDLSKFHRLQSVFKPYNAEYTVTLRRTVRKTYRNSDEPLWREFAKKIGAVVIEDYYVKPIGLYERMALYAGAKMNFGVTNGPMALLMITSYPAMMWDCSSSIKGFRRHGINVGDSFPWLLPSQSMKWEKPTMELLMGTMDKIK
jgi:hypothetical protein